MNEEIKKENYIFSDLFADFLVQNEITTVFGLIGAANAYLFDAIRKRGYTKVVYMHHEQAVVMAAGAYYRSNGKVTFAIVTAGGGASNAITGVISNWADSIPCVVIAGQESTKFTNEHAHLRMLGTQGFNAAEMVKNVVKFSTTILDKKKALQLLEQAYFTSTEGRPGPTWLDIPIDIQSSKITTEDYSHFTNNIKYEYNSNIDSVIELLSKAKRPVILGGHGIRLSNAKIEFQNLLKKLKIPTLLSWSAIDLLADDNIYNFGRPGVYGQRSANFILQNCDLLIVLGSRLTLPQIGYNIENFAPAAKIIFVNNDKNELNKYSRYDLAIYDDCKLFINELNKITFSINTDDWVERCKKFKLEFPTIENHHKIDNENFDNSYVLIDELSDLMTEEDILAIGQGSPLPSAHQAFKVKEGQIVFASNGLGEMGNGLPSAIGAALACKDKNVILLDGDGSMMMNLQELQTVVGYDLPIKIIIFNNEGYLFIKHTQKMLFNSCYTGVNTETGVSLPNFKKIAEAFNIPYFNSKLNTLNEFLKSEKYSIFECFMNPEQDLTPKVKGILTDNGIISVPLEEMSPLLPIEIIENNVVKVNELSYKIRK
jgi:acetolactate synthase-1/2/3 large subunit